MNAPKIFENIFSSKKRSSAKLAQPSPSGGHRPENKPGLKVEIPATQSNHALC